LFSAIDSLESLDISKNSDAIILRLFNFSGAGSELDVELDQCFQPAAKVNFIEQILAPISIDEPSLRLILGQKQISTLRLIRG